MKTKQLKARSPAKLILSGEHAVVYGKPAIAMAINRYAESTILTNLSSSILFNFLNLHYAKNVTRSTLSAIKGRLQENYREFLEGNCSIRGVIKKPFELLQFTVSHLLESLNVVLPEGLEIRTASDIPIGCGMGSSSAIVMSTLYALSHFLGLDLDPVRFLSLGREAENLQHGRSSGLDIQLAMSGGCLRFQNNKAIKRELPNVPMILVQTGHPDSTTGECVEAVSKWFTTSSIAEDFEGVTNEMDKAIQDENLIQFQDSIRENHQLLSKIGVVPAKIQAFIQEVEQQGGAAKICGAGSVKGDNAGAVLVISEHNLEDVASRFGYCFQSIEGDFRGTCVV